MLRLVYFLSIMAMISVPPLEAPRLKRMAVPTAGRKMANSSSSKGSVVRGLLKGQTRSSRDRLMDMTILA